MAKNREISIFNLSFLDVLSNGMGALILLMFIFSVLVREQRIQEGQRLFIVVTYDGSSKKMPNFSIKAPSQELCPFVRMDNRPMVQVFCLERASPGHWQIVAEQAPEGTYALVVYYGDTLLTHQSGLRSALPGRVVIPENSKGAVYE